ncbi:penicillin-binding protein 2 [Angustibacter sp. McL0619]|uniref:penicillin-binding protein 2 n=1 Tax=Angustibacter sp. McL0619 TaxID=3415676 RepID=UPI003CF3227B
MNGGARSTRLLVVGVFVLSLMVTLGARLFTVQVVGADGYRAASNTNREREIVTPAVRGLVLDDRGRPLLSNRTALVVSISRTTLLNSKDEGRALVQRLATALRLPFATVWGRTQLCGTKGAPKPPVCFNGAPYQPVPVAQDVDPRIALQIMERSEDFPGVTAELQAVRTIPEPLGVNAAHLLGYLGPVTDDELKASSAAAREGRAELQRTDRVGRAGLEKQYDAALRGTPGVTDVGVDIRGRLTGELNSTDPVAGNYVVTSIDAKVQAATEKALAKGIKEARTRNASGGGGKLKADSGAAVVMDVRTGQIVAMASWPTYDPKIWLGGITDKELAGLTDEKAGTPMVSRATQGLFPPASTFKVVSLPAAVQSGYDLHGSYQCSSSYQVGERAFHNYESEAYGTIDLHKAIVVSCDTIFYKFAYETWLRLGGSDNHSDAKDPFVAMAKAFGLGKDTGIDLPDDVSGRIPDRAWKQAYWDQTKKYYCTKAKTGFPEVAKDDPSRAAFLTQLAKENCADGNVFRGGDAANFAIGQGDVTVSPLQMVRVYGAIANGGTLWTPHVGKAIVTPAGKLVQRIAPKKAGTVPIRADVLRFLHSALRGVVTSGTASGAFAGFPVPVSGKTGTGEVYGKQATSWFSSYAPSNSPQYAVSVVVSQGGTGATTSGPIVRDIYSAIFGVRGSKLVPGAAALPGGRPPAGLPTIRPDGTIVTPEGPVASAEGLPDPRAKATR